MKIEIWSDFTCPWCYIGKQNLEAALKNKNIQVEYIYHSYQTVAQDFYPVGEAFSIYDIADRSGMNHRQALQKAKLIEDMGKKSGIVLNMDMVKMTNTTNAHRLLQLAHHHKCQDAFMMKGYRAVFVEGQHIGDKNVLKKISIDSGIPEQEINSLLESDDYLTQVQEDIKSAQVKHISGVPYFLFDERQSLYGAQSVRTFSKVINKIADKTTPTGGFCSNGSCQL